MTSANWAAAGLTVSGDFGDILRIGPFVKPQRRLPPAARAEVQDPGLVIASSLSQENAHVSEDEQPCS